MVPSLRRGVPSHPSCLDFRHNQNVMDDYESIAHCHTKRSICGYLNLVILHDKALSSFWMIENGPRTGSPWAWIVLLVHTAAFKLVEPASCGSTWSIFTAIGICHSTMNTFGGTTFFTTTLSGSGTKVWNRRRTPCLTDCCRPKEEPDGSIL